MDKKQKKSAGYLLLYSVTYLHAMLPLGVLYLLSDILWLFVYHIVRYRRKLVRMNLGNAFPEKPVKEIRRLERKFYHHLCDYFVETIKMLHLSDSEARVRMKFENPEIISRLTRDGRSCLMCMGHYGNWEWVTSFGINHLPELKQGFLYKRLRSKPFDLLFLKIRNRFRPEPIEMRRAFRKMIQLNNDGKAMLVGFLADQRPPKNNDHYWTTFLNQDTLVQTGMEKIANHLGLSVVYLDITKVKRGYYTGKFYVITPDASLEPEFEIMERYMRKLEETILKEPAYYLWSHNRWKFRKK